MSNSREGAMTPDSLDAKNPEIMQTAEDDPQIQPGSGQEEEDSPRASSRQLDPQEINYKKLCQLISELGPQAMRQVFNNIHPPINLVDTLARPAITVPLRRLRALGLLTTEEWELLYPQRKSQANSANYDPTLLYTLLRNISPLTAPYPDGWYGVPHNGDISISADLVRIQWFRTLLVNKSNQDSCPRMTDKEFKAYWQQIKDIFVRLGGMSIKVKLERLERERSAPATEKDYLKVLQNWDYKARDLEAKEAEIDKLRNKDGNDFSESFSEYNQGSQAMTSNSPSHKLGRQQSEGKVGAPGDNKPKLVQKQMSRRRSQHMTKDVTTLTKEELRAHEKSVLLKFYRQLTEVVQSDDVIPKLIQRSLMSHEEKNRINLATRNADRMKMVLELLAKKSGNSFDKFCDVIKYKYKKLSDQMIKAKQSPLRVEKPDEKTQCHTALVAAYRNMLQVIAPLPWHPEVTVTMKDFLLPYHITDFYGRIVSTDHLFSQHPKCERPKRLLLQGLDGVGKSSLLHQLAYQWSQGGKGHGLERFKLVFLIDLKKVTGSLSDTLTEQCLAPGGYIRSHTELDNLIRKDEENILFLLDGYENINDIESNIWELVHRDLYPNSSLIMSTNTRFVSSGLLKNFDTQLVLLGIEPDTQEDMVRHYSELTQTSIETYAGLLTKVVSEYNTTIRTYSLNPLYGLYLCLVTEMGGSLDFHTMSYMMNAVVWALQKLYCQKNDLSISEDSIPDDVKEVLGLLEKLALEKLVKNNVLLTQREIEEESSDAELTAQKLMNMGLLQLVDDNSGAGFQDGKVYCFVHRFLQEFLAARHLSKIDVEDFNDYLDGLINEKHLHKVASLFCGIHRYDYNLRTMRELFKSLDESNKSQSSMSRRSTRDTVFSNKDLLSGRREARLMSFAMCLDCLAEAEGRKDVLELVQDNFPWRLYMKHRVHHSPSTLVGLGHILKANITSVTELELRLDHVGAYYEHFFMVLADAIEENTHLLTLKIRWTREDLLAVFLANVFGKNTSLRHLHLSDESHSVQDCISATVWSNLWSAGNNMQHIQTLAFTHCKNPAIVTSFIRNSPATLQNLYLNSCKIDLIGAQELSTKIEKSKSLHLLNISSVKLKRSDFLYLAYGLKLNKSISEFVLNDTQLDENSALALAEAVMINTTLKRLHLQKVFLSTGSCRALGNALGINQSILEVDLRDAQIPEEGTRLLWRLKRDRIILTGLNKKDVISLLHTPEDPVSTTTVTLPAIKT